MPKKRINAQLGDVFEKMAELYEVNGVAYKPAAFRRAATTVRGLKQDITALYEAQGLKGLKELSGVGQSTASKIAEYVDKGRIRGYEELREKTALRDLITHFFGTKGVSLAQLKRDARKKRIVYSRHTLAAKELLELAGSVDEAKRALDRVAAWANSRGLDYTIETVAKRWLELDRLEPKEEEPKATYRGMPMVFSRQKNKWYVVNAQGEWLEFAGDEKDIEWEK